VIDFDGIYAEYIKDVYRYAYSLCRNEAIAEDITQETFFKAMKNIESFKENCKIRVWLCQITKNTYYSFCKRERIYIELPDEQGLYGAEGLEQELITIETAFEVHKALHKLSEPYKEVFSLRQFGDLSFSQIAELFDKTESWARVTYHRAKIKLKEELQ